MVKTRTAYYIVPRCSPALVALTQDAGVVVQGSPKGRRLAIFRSNHSNLKLL
jgi:hypothetical protein